MTELEMTSAVLGALDPKLASPGLGAWSFYYKYGWAAGDDPRRRAGILAVKHALIDSGYPKGIDLTMFVFGDAARNRTVEFQKDHALTADGVVGPTTMRRLLSGYVANAEYANGIPDHLLGKLCTGESNNDPIAEGVVDPEDEGVLQFHLPYWPNVQLVQAWNPAYEIELAGAKLAALRAQTHSWKGAVAAWNIGTTYAKQWVDSGYPTAGGPVMGSDADGNPIYAFERATNYWAYIDALPF